MFYKTLITANALCDNLIQLYKKLDKKEDAIIAGEFYFLLRSAEKEIDNWLQSGEANKTPSQPAKQLVIANITFRLGDMNDPDVFNQTELIVFPIAASGRVRKDAPVATSQSETEIWQLGEVVIDPLPSGKPGPRLRAWACSLIEGEGSEYEAIETVCTRLVEGAFRENVKVVSLPLLGVGNGGLDPIPVAEIYRKILTRPDSSLHFIVSILSPRIFQQIQEYDGFRISEPIHEPTPPARPKKDEPDIKSRLISDTYTADETDVLQYDVIAQNLFAILTDKGTNPPLNIGIFAPWGRGKTNLMKRLQGKFDEERKKLTGPEDPGSQKLKGWRQMLRWLRSEESEQDAPKLPYATVWFNPWNYQSSDMIWAGMADAVIEQVVGQIPSRARKEAFWMQLRLSRLAKEKIRKDIQTRLLFYFLQLFCWGILVLLAFVIFFLNKTIPWALLGVGGVGSLIASVASKINPLSKSISEEFDKYSEAPKYQEKTGTFHEVQADLNKVLDLCIDDKKPLVIFVDDLDRCSPSKVVEVVEAINVFINGRFNTKCYFILGMDGELVAGALDVCYEKMKGKLGSREMDQGSIGWYFLDKFIQLPYFIPVMSESKKKEYLINLLSEKKTTGTNGTNGTTDRPGSATKEPAAPANMVKVEKLAKTVLSTSDNQASSQVIKDAGLSLAEQKELDKLILQNQVESEKQNETIQKQVSAYAPFISSDPRSLKRFANLLRFYSAYQFLRMKKGQVYVEAPILAKWLAIMLKFPQLVRWIQWDSENKSGIHTAAEEKVKLLDDLLEGYFKDKVDQHFTGWLAYKVSASISSNGKDFSITEFDEVPWLRSRKLFDILMNEKAELSSFKNALECNVW